MKNNILWVDWAKFIGIYLVIFGHLLQKTCFNMSGVKELWEIIYLFHMPCFFILSGFLYKKGKVVKIVLSLIVPYIIYQSVFLLYNILVGLKDAGNLWDITRLSFMGFLMGDGYNTPISQVLCLPCWFIINIIQLRIIFHFVDINKRNSIIFILASIFFLYLRRYLSFDLYFCIDSTIMSIPYFIIGYYFRNFYDIKGLKINFLLSILILTVLLFGIYSYNGFAQMNGPSVGRDPILNYAGGLSGSAIVIFIAMLIKNGNSLVLNISRNTLFIIFFHWLLLIIMGKLQIFKLWNFIDNSLIAVFFTTLLSFLLLFPINHVIKFLEIKYPIVLGKYAIRKS
jgi:fucose 4-O-acetylase-like acetyltransferase